MPSTHAPSSHQEAEASRSSADSGATGMLKAQPTLHTCRLPKYQYRALEQPSDIRILVLKPAVNFMDPLIAEIVHANDSLTEPLLYSAVSYCWGEPSFDYNLLCEGRTELAITRNVDRMLRYFRRPHKEKRLWIDAICLNQNDVAEKSQQVQRMSSIYAKATKTYIWLGPATDDRPSLVFTALKRVWHHTRLQGSNSYDNEAIRKERETICEKAYVPLFQYLYSSSWFFRRRIIQEASFSPNTMVHWGFERINWSEFVLAGRLLSDMADESLRTSLKAFVIPLLSKMWDFQSLGPSSILDLLWAYHLSDCSLPHDRIYALYNIASDLSRLPKVDYAKTWQQVYSEVATVLWSEDKIRSLKHLVSFGPMASSHAGYRSWVPDWRKHRIKWALMDSRVLAAFSNHDLGDFRLSFQTGRKIGGWLSISTSHSTRTTEVYSSLASFLWRCCQPPRMPTQALEDLLSAALIEHQSISPPYGFLRQIRALLKDMVFSQCTSDPESIEAWSCAVEHDQRFDGAWDTLRALKSMFKLCPGFYAEGPKYSEVSLIGISPREVRLGDAIVEVPLGRPEPDDFPMCFLPIVLRPVSTGTYTFLGHCYCAKDRRNRAAWLTTSFEIL